MASGDEHDSTATAGDNLRAFRLAAGLTQEQLAQKAGIDRSWLNQMERGKRPIGPSPRGKLAKALRVDPVELGGDEEALRPAARRSILDRLEELAANDACLLENQEAAIREIAAIRAMCERILEDERTAPKQSRSR